MPANMTTQLDDARRALLTDNARDNLQAARIAFGRLTAYTVQLQSHLDAGRLDAETLATVARQARYLKLFAEELWVNLP